MFIHLTTRDIRGEFGAIETEVRAAEQIHGKRYSRMFLRDIILQESIQPFVAAVYCRSQANQQQCRVERCQLVDLK